MIGFVFSVLFFIATGVLFIVRRKEMAHGMALAIGSAAVPGCAVAMGMGFLGLAGVAVVLYQLGLLGRF